MSKPSIETPTSEKQTFSNKVRRMFGFDLHGWENIMVLSLVVAGAFALAAGVATYLVVKLQRVELSQSKDEFDRYKLEAGERISSATAEALKAQLALEKMKAPRSLELPQALLMAGKLNSFVGQQWTATSYWDLKEPMALTNALKKTVLDISGWIYDNEGSSSHILGIITGVEVYVHPAAQESTQLAAKALVDALNEAGLEATLKQQNAPDNPNNKLHLNVGTKP